MAFTLRSSHAKRRAAVTKRQIVRTKVKRRHHRRFAGVRGDSANLRKGRAISKARHPKPSKTGRHRRFFGRKKHVGPRRKPGTAPAYVRKGRHGKRHFKGRKKVTMRKGLKRHFKGRKKVTMRKGLHRKFKGRKKVTMRKGLHRRFLGRKKSTKKRAYHGRRKSVKPIRAGSVISSQSYINMFS
jgi:hypothetical protein